MWKYFFVKTSTTFCCVVCDNEWIYLSTQCFFAFHNPFLCVSWSQTVRTTTMQAVDDFNMEILFVKTSNTFHHFLLCCMPQLMNVLLHAMLVWFSLNPFLCVSWSETVGTTTKVVDENGNTFRQNCFSPLSWILSVRTDFFSPWSWEKHNSSLQGGINCGTIEEASRSSKAID